MSEKTSKKRKRDEEAEEEVELEHKRKKKKSNKDKEKENKNNEEEKISEEVVDTDVESTRKKKSKNSKKSDKVEEEGSGKEEKQKKKHRKEKSKKDKADPDQESAANENNTNEPEKKKKKKKKKKTPEPAEPIEVDEGIEAESSKKPKKKKKKSKSKKDDKEEESSTNAKVDTADEMSETNIATKRGKYSAAENELLEKSLLDYINAQGWDKTEGLDKVCNGKMKERQGAWIEIASVLPDREWRSVASHCRRTFNPDNYKGEWSEDDIERLQQLVKEYSRAWRRIGTELGRLPTACRDKWREIMDIDSLSTGKWSEEEDAKLLAALKEMNNGTLPTDDSPPILWSVVCKRVGTRNQDACRARWRKIDPSKQKSILEWTDDDSKKLLVKVHSMYPQDESEILFSQLSKKWAYKAIQIRWKVLLKHAPDYQNKSLPDNLKALIKHFELKKKDIENIKNKIEEEG